MSVTSVSGQLQQKDGIEQKRMLQVMKSNHFILHSQANASLCQLTAAHTYCICHVRVLITVLKARTTAAQVVKAQVQVRSILGHRFNYAIGNCASLQKCFR